MAALDQKTALTWAVSLVGFFGVMVLNDMRSDLKATAEAVPSISQDVALIKQRQEHDRQLNEQGFDALQSEWDLFKDIFTPQTLAEIKKIKAEGQG